MKTEVRSSALGLFHDLLVHSRSCPEVEDYLIALEKLRPFLSAKSGESMDRFFAEPKPLDQNERTLQVFALLSKTYVSESGSTCLEINDLNFLSEICTMAADIRAAKDRELTHDFSDAFHGVASAVQNPELNRREYSERYFRPFLKKWLSSLRPESVKKITSWSASNPHRTRALLEACARALVVAAVTFTLGSSAILFFRGNLRLHSGDAGIFVPLSIVPWFFLLGFTLFLNIAGSKHHRFSFWAVVWCLLGILIAGSAAPALP